MFRNTVKVLSTTALLAAVALASTDAFAHGGHSSMSAGPAGPSVGDHPVGVTGSHAPHPPGITIHPPFGPGGSKGPYHGPIRTLPIRGPIVGITGKGPKGPYHGPIRIPPIVGPIGIFGPSKPPPSSPGSPTSPTSTHNPGTGVVTGSADSSSVDSACEVVHKRTPSGRFIEVCN